MADAAKRLEAALADRYRIERELGAGGMATVYLAKDLKHDRNVALKVLRPDLSFELGAARFLREIRLAAGLTHPHILPLFDSGEVDGVLYYVMPLVEGASLRDRLREIRQLPVEEVAQIGAEVAAALDYAHRHDVVHRDIKPENILIQAGHAVVADFGIGKAVTAAADDSATLTLTQTGVTVGTPAYMSPEQAAGEAAIDGRSDLYSLGCVLYELLTGEAPFTGATAQAVIARRFAHTPPPVTKTRDAVPVGLSDVVDRLLQRVPADRFATGAELAAALQSGHRRRPAADAEDNTIAVLPFANMSADPENAFFADGITEELINALAQIPGLNVASRTSCFYFKGRSPELAEVGAKLHVATVLEGSVRRAGDRLRITVQLIDVARDQHLWSERYDRTMDDVFAVQDEIANVVANRLRMSVGPNARIGEQRHAPSDLRAYELYLKGRTLLYQRGAGIVKGLACMQEALALDPDYPMALAGAADATALMALYGLGPPGRHRETGLAAARRAVTLAPNLAEAHNALGFANLFLEWNWPAAEAAFLRAIELNPRYLQASAAYAVFYLALLANRFDQAADITRRCIEFEPLSGYAHTMHACCLAFGGRPLEGLPFAERGCVLDPDAYLSHMGMLICHDAAGQFDQAVASAQRALAVSGRHPWALSVLCVSLAEAGRDEAARAVHGELTSRAVAEYVQPWMLAVATSAIGEADAAIAHADRAYDERDASLAAFGRTFPAGRRLRADPRFRDILGRMALPAWEG